tara:strand:+ start:2418 stop:2696 length:279 start_codon:yes stop_codon:yes gene_type:complete
MEGKEITYIHEDRTYIFECPQCDCPIQVSYDQLNCKIFRHGVMKSTMIQINPHLPEDECNRLREEGLIFGCGRPFQIVKDEEKLYAIVCDYI